MRKKVKIPMNYNDIAAMLAAGKSADEIAKEFTDALNKATAEQKAAEETAKANEAKSKKMDEISMTIAHALNEYAVLAGIPDVKLRGTEVRTILDEFLPVIEQLKDIKIHVTKTEPKKAKTAKFKSPEDVFDWFFGEIGV